MQGIEVCSNLVILRQLGTAGVASEPGRYVVHLVLCARCTVAAGGAQKTYATNHQVGDVWSTKIEGDGDLNGNGQDSSSRNPEYGEAPDILQAYAEDDKVFCTRRRQHSSNRRGSSASCSQATQQEEAFCNTENIGRIGPGCMIVTPSETGLVTLTQVLQHFMLSFGMHLGKPK